MKTQNSTLKPRLTPIGNGQSGPKTDVGKAKSSKNALKHGLTAKSLVIPGEDADDYDAYIAEMVESLAPVGVIEAELARNIGSTLWQQRRVERWNAAVIRLSVRAQDKELEKQIEQVDDKILGLTSERSQCQRDPATEPPFLLRLAELQDDTPVDGSDVIDVYCDWKSRLPESISPPKLEEICKQLGIPEKPAANAQKSQAPTPDNEKLQTKATSKHVKATQPSKPETSPESNPKQNSPSSTQEGESKRSAESDAPQSSEPAQDFDALTWDGWQARHARLVLNHLVTFLDVTAAEYVHEAEVRWQTELPEKRLARRRDCARLKREIQVWEQHRQDLLTGQTVPEPIRADLLQRYDSYGVRKLEKLFRTYQQLQQTRRGSKRGQAAPSPKPRLNRKR